MNDQAVPPGFEDPFDDKSRQLLLSLPVRPTIVTHLLTALKVIALVPGFIGAWAVAQGALGQHEPGAQIRLMLVGAAFLIVAALLWVPAEVLLFEKAPLGDLVGRILDGLRLGKIEKVGQIAGSIVRNTAPGAGGTTGTSQPDADGLATTFARALALTMLAEISKEEAAAASWAAKAVPVHESCAAMGLDTPLHLFLSATSMRIAGRRSEAVEAYTKYLALRPNDQRAREVMETLTGEATPA